MPHTINVGSRSLFVTATAWAFILFGLSISASALVQNAHIESWLPWLRVAADDRPLPLLSGLLMSYLPWVVGAELVMSLAMLASAFGLLLRWDWARRVFIGILAAAIAVNLAGLWLQHELVHSVVANTLALATLPPAVTGILGGFATAAQAMAALVTLGACAVLAWIIGSLMSPRVRQEFA
jgi:hypothetical protein